MATRIVVMRDGTIQQVGAPQELYDRPQNLFVAGFIGSPAMNFFTAQLIGAGGSKLIAGFRPEHMRVDGRGGDGLRFVARADVIEYLGNEKLVNASLDGQALTALVPVEEPISEGEDISFGVPREKLHLFDAETEQAVGST